MKVWIDLSNSPHPLLFAPIARRLEDLGHVVDVTARDNAQTVDLARERWDDITVIGDESPSGRVRKGWALARRIGALSRWAVRHRPDVALSHNSYSQIAAARLTRTPVVTAMDFEHQPANHVAFRLADAILVPQVMPLEAIKGFGAIERKLHRYPGLKEELYLGDFQPDAGVLRQFRIERADETVVVVVRTPPSRALYHSFENPLFRGVLETLGRQPRVRVIALVRHSEQRSAIEALELENVIVPEKVVDSRSLTYLADLVVGAGGTMTREAALMGVPTLSAFAGKQPAVDRALENEGRLSRLEDLAQVDGVDRRQQAPEPVECLRQRGELILQVFVGAIESTVA